MRDNWLTAGGVAKIADVTPATARLWADSGRLQVTRTASGIRLYRRANVLAWVRERSARQRAVASRRRQKVDPTTIVSRDAGRKQKRNEREGPAAVSMTKEP